MVGVALLGLAVFLVAHDALLRTARQRELATWRISDDLVKVEGARRLLTQDPSLEEPRSFLERTTREPGKERPLLGLRELLAGESPEQLRLLAARLAYYQQDWLRTMALFEGQQLILQDSLRLSLCHFARGHDAQALEALARLYPRRPDFVLQVLPLLEAQNSPLLLPVLATAALWSLEGKPTPARLVASVQAPRLRCRLLGTLLRSEEKLEKVRIEVCRALLVRAESLHLRGADPELPPLDPWGERFAVGSDSPHVRSAGWERLAGNGRGSRD